MTSDNTTETVRARLPSRKAKQPRMLPSRNNPAAMDQLVPPPLSAVSIAPDSFWGKRRAINRSVTVPSQLRQLRNTNRIAALDPEWKGPRNPFWDSDLAKWLEAAWCELEGGGDDKGLRRAAQEVLQGFGGAMEPDGYLQSHTSFCAPENKWRNLRDGHELYSMGHVIEACCAHHEGGNGGEGLALAGRILDHLWRQFGPDGRPAYCGHPEIEMALMRLWKQSGDERAHLLAQLMVDRRGTLPHLFEIEAAACGEDYHQHWSWRLTKDWRYYQAHRPVREQVDADGHSVRALYLYSGMTDLCTAGDQSLSECLDRLWESVVHRRMFVTGGIGSTREGERFTYDYDLPDNNSYCETCAAIGLARWAQRMLGRRLCGEYGDVLELALHNAMIAGVSLDGEHYFYGNPLAIHPHDRRSREEVAASRRPWFDCACCPPNIARTLAQLASFAYGVSDQVVAVHLYFPGTVTLNGFKLRIETGMPWDGKTRIEIAGNPAAGTVIALRIPGWCPEPSVAVNGIQIGIESICDGYACISHAWKNGDLIDINFPMPVQRIYAHPAVRSAVGKVALRRGPLVYCMEEADCGRNLDDVVLPDESDIFAEETRTGRVLKTVGNRSLTDAWSGALYRTSPARRGPAPIVWVPYCEWGHRGGAEMRVWTLRSP